jgi:hypothetical protein
VLTLSAAHHSSAQAPAARPVVNLVSEAVVARVFPQWVPDAAKTTLSGGKFPSLELDKIAEILHPRTDSFSFQLTRFDAPPGVAYVPQPLLQDMTAFSVTYPTASTIQTEEQRKIAQNAADLLASISDRPLTLADWEAMCVGKRHQYLRFERLVGSQARRHAGRVNEVSDLVEASLADLWRACLRGNHPSLDKTIVSYIATMVEYRAGKLARMAAGRNESSADDLEHVAAWDWFAAADEQRYQADAVLAYDFISRLPPKQRSAMYMLAKLEPEEIEELGGAQELALHNARKKSIRPADGLKVGSRLRASLIDAARRANP